MLLLLLGTFYGYYESMDLFSELISTVQSDLTIGDETSLYTPTTVKLALNRAYRKVGGLFRWPELEDAKKTSTVIDQEYYDYPNNWRPDSVWKLKVDGEDYGDPLTFPDYLYEKEEEFPSGLQKAWANQWRRFFIYPTPTTNGNNNICVWGQKVVETLVDNSDVTIFSYSMPEVNEAIVLEAGAILKSKGELEDRGAFRSAEAKQIVIVAWGKIRQEQAKHEKTRPFWDVPDYFGRPKTKTTIGNFD